MAFLRRWRLHSVNPPPTRIDHARHKADLRLSLRLCTTEGIVASPLRIHEPRARNLATVVGAMRNIRTLSGIFGLSFLANHVFYRAPKK